MRRNRSIIHLLSVLTVACTTIAALGGTPASAGGGIVATRVVGGLNGPAAFTVLDDGRIVYAERGTVQILLYLAHTSINIRFFTGPCVHGDVVRVHSRDESKVFVSGEVVSPKALTMHNGRLTLNEALGESGGVSPLSGDARQIYVVRKTPERTRVFQLDARVTGALAMAESFELRPKDVVYVAASPLANWNRHLSMLFPGALTSAVGVTTRP